MRTHSEIRAAADRVLAEEPVPVSKLARTVPAERGERGYISAATLVRWIRTGKQGVYLDGIRGPGKSWLSSREALARFFAALSTIDLAEPSLDPPLERERRARAAEAELARLRAATR